MRSATLAVCCLVSTLLLIPSASADAGGVTTKPAIYIAAGGGLTFPTGDFSSFYNTGRHLTGIVALDLGAVPLRFRVKGTYFKMDEPGVLFGVPRSSGNFKGQGGLAELAWTPRTHSRLKPYVFAGGGVFDFTTKHGDFTGEDFETSETQGALSFGGGTDIKWGHFGMFAEWSYYHITTTPAVNFHQFTLGANYAIPL